MLTPEETDALAGKLCELAVAWADGDPRRLEEAARIMARSPYLGCPPAREE